MKKVVFIDWSKTLSYGLFWEQLQDKKHPNSTYWLIIRKWLFIDNRDLLDPWMRGKLSTKEVLDRMSQDTGLDRSLLEQELKISCENMRFCIDNLPQIIARIQKLGIKVVIATDNMDTFSRYTVPAMSLKKIFDDIIDSCQIGYLKDDKLPSDQILFFDKYLSDHDWSYRDAILLDNSPDETGKYKRLGFERILIDGPDSLRSELEKIADAI